jgi:hypothetical protein
VATVVVLPVYYVTVLGINHNNKKAVMMVRDDRLIMFNVSLSELTDDRFRTSYISYQDFS